MVGVEERKIGENTYAVTQFGAKQGRKVLFRLTKMLGPAMAGLVKGGFSGEGVASALQTFSESAQEADFDYLCDAFAEVTVVRQPVVSTAGNEIKVALAKVFDTHFRGHYGNMLLWLAFAVEVNFASFFGEITSGDGPLADLLAAKTAPEAPKSE